MSDQLDLSTIANALTDDDRTAFRKVFPGVTDRIALSGVMLGSLTFVFSLFANLRVAAITGLLAISAFSLLWLVASIFRDVAWFWREAKDPLASTNAAYNRHLWAITALKSQGSDTLRSMYAFVRHRQEQVPKRLAFFCGALETIGLVPLLIAAWWAWRDAGAPSEFQFPEKLLLAFAVGVFAGAIAMRSKLEALGKIELVLSEALRLRHQEECPLHPAALQVKPPDGP
ncbi:hypothetical protein ACHZ97_00665 [Lysobacter soli]|uniref:hypothetical protein n=1 Tax=Lysobacter soli TaxID=453783 RepID=UPI0037CB58DA